MFYLGEFSMRKIGKKIKNFCKAGTPLSLLFVGLVAATVFMTVSFEPLAEQQVIKEQIEATRYWREPLGKHVPGGDNSGYTYFMTYPHDATPNVTYASNLTPAGSYEEHDVINSELNNETPHSTTFDFILQIVLNDTVNYNSSSSNWMYGWIHANITVDFDFAADVSWTNCSLTLVGNNSDFAWYNCWINNAGAGYQITNNEKFNATVNVTLWW
jgi:hypothetical protein